MPNQKPIFKSAMEIVTKSHILSRTITTYIISDIILFYIQCFVDKNITYIYIYIYIYIYLVAQNPG